VGKSLWVTVLWLVAQAARGQGAPPETIHSNSTLVVVPALVETTSGELVPSLGATDFLLTDNGVEQTVALEQVERQPVALVALLQIGGAAQRQIPNLRGLPAMIDAATAGSPRKIAMVTFDSEPEEASDFTDNVDDLKYDLIHPKWGNNGAAILDAVDYGISLLDQQPASTRRVLLLVSQTHDDGSKAQAEDIVHRLGETNTMIYSLTFSPEKTWLKDQFTQERHENPLYEFSPGLPPLLHTFNLDGPFRVALRAMRENTAAEIAMLSGGESLPFGDRADMDRQLSTLANHLPNRYTLTFRPSSNEPGFHAIEVRVLHQPETATVKARESYWATRPSQ
jgi:VWFA-related protein